MVINIFAIYVNNSTIWIGNIVIYGISIYRVYICAFNISMIIIIIQKQSNDATIKHTCAQCLPANRCVSIDNLLALFHS